MRKLYQNLQQLFADASKIITISFLVFLCKNTFAQCPPNIDFEQGNFNGWQCWTGITSTSSANGENVITWDPGSPSTPVATRHTIISAASGNTLDTFGLFPQSCPNGSGYSIKLGNTRTLNQAEGVSYTFTIPAGQNKFNLIYNYAVVFEGPNHSTSQQPRLKISVEDLTDNKELGCSSFSFIPSDYLPGFFLSKNKSTGTAVWCKDWSANSINLDGNAGKTIRIFFTTTDCTLNAHFGYAYIDLNTECNGSFLGSTFCAGDTVVSVTAPFGYQNYVWYNKDFSKVLGSQQILTISPPPLSGDSVKVVVTPYSGYGCIDTLAASLHDTLTATANAGTDITTCNLTAGQIGVPPNPDLVYRWSPVSGLDNPNVSNPTANPLVFTEYLLTVTSKGGGCKATDRVAVTTKVSDTSLNLIGNRDYCIGVGRFPELRVNNTDSIQWFKDNVAVSKAWQNKYLVNTSGEYFAKLFRTGCPLPMETKKIKITIDSAKIGIRYPVTNAVFDFPEPLQARQIGVSALWSPSINLNTTNTYTPIFKGLNEQLYLIQLKTTIGCLTVDTQLVKTYKKIAIYIPTAFTPDGNGLNERLRPVLVGFNKVNYFRVYNRWGKLLFSMNSDQPGWDGKIDNKPSDTQSVVWMIEAVDVDGKVHKKQGSTVLYR
jgi:gliding motility-associated-like protein